MTLNILLVLFIIIIIALLALGSIALYSYSKEDHYEEEHKHRTKASTIHDMRKRTNKPVKYKPSSVADIKKRLRK